MLEATGVYVLAIYIYICVYICTHVFESIFIFVFKIHIYIYVVFRPSTLKPKLDHCFFVIGSSFPSSSLLSRGPEYSYATSLNSHSTRAGAFLHHLETLSAEYWILDLGSWILDPAQY